MEESEEDAVSNPWSGVSSGPIEAALELTDTNLQSKPPLVLHTEEELKRIIAELFRAVADKSKRGVSAVEAVLQYDIDINTARESDGMTALHVAVALNNVEVALFLLGKGANWRASDISGVTPERIAADSDFVDSKIVDMFFEKDKLCDSLRAAMKSSNFNFFRDNIKKCTEIYQLQRLKGRAAELEHEVAVAIGMGASIESQIGPMLNVCWARLLTLELEKGNPKKLLDEMNDNLASYRVKTIVNNLEQTTRDTLKTPKFESYVHIRSCIAEVEEELRIRLLPEIEKAIVESNVGKVKECLLEALKTATGPHDFAIPEEGIIRALLLFEKDFTFEWFYRRFLMEKNESGVSLYFCIKDTVACGCKKFNNIVVSEKAANVLSVRTSPVVSRVVTSDPAPSTHLEQRNSNN